MHSDVLLHPGESLTVKAGEHTLQIIRDSRGHTGVMDGRGAWMPPLNETSDQSFPVIENHPAHSDNGEQAKAMIAEVDGEAGDALPGDVEGVIGYLSNIVRVHPLGPAIILLKVERPHLSIREMTAGMRIQRTALSEAIRKLVRHDGRLGRLLLGHSTNASAAQQKRRRRERAVHYA